MPSKPGRYSDQRPVVAGSLRGSNAKSPHETWSTAAHYSTTSAAPCGAPLRIRRGTWFHCADCVCLRQQFSPCDVCSLHAFLCDTSPVPCTLLVFVRFPLALLLTPPPDPHLNTPQTNFSWPCVAYKAINYSGTDIWVSMCVRYVQRSHTKRLWSRASAIFACAHHCVLRWSLPCRSPGRPRQACCRPTAVSGLCWPALRQPGGCCAHQHEPQTTPNNRQVVTTGPSGMETNESEGPVEGKEAVLQQVFYGLTL